MASTSLLDSLSASETEQKRAVRSSEAKLQLLSLAERSGSIPPDQIYKRRRQALAFDSADTAIWADISDPPLTTAFRQAIAGIAAYNAAMTALASGQAAETLIAQTERIYSAGIGIAGLDPVKVLAAGTQAQIFVDLAKTLIKLGLEYRSREIFQAEMLASAPAVQATLEYMRVEGSEIIFARIAQPEIEVLANAGIGGGSGSLARSASANDAFFDVTPASTGGTNAAFDVAPEDAAAALVTIDQKRILVANWAEMLRRTEIALQAAIKAVESGSSGANLALAEATVVELNVAATALRKALATLRN